MLDRIFGGAAFGALTLCASMAQADLLYDQNVTPVNGVTNGMIFGGGNDNGAFTVDRNAGVELGLRGKLRHNAAGAPENTFNSNGDGTYSFAAGVAPTQASPTAVWSFEWAVNTNYLDAQNGRNLNDLTYALGLDSDPGIATFFTAFDPINVNCADHSIGTNATLGGAGFEADCVNDPGAYAELIDQNNVAQQSWKAHWYIPSFDPEVNGFYDLYLAAFDGNALVARTDIRVCVGDVDCVPIETPEPAALGLLGLGLVGLVAARRRKP